MPCSEVDNTSRNKIYVNSTVHLLQYVIPHSLCRVPLWSTVLCKQVKGLHFASSDDTFCRTAIFCNVRRTNQGRYIYKGAYGFYKAKPHGVAHTGSCVPGWEIDALHASKGYNKQMVNVHLFTQTIKKYIGVMT